MTRGEGRREGKCVGVRVMVRRERGGYGVFGSLVVNGTRRKGMKRGVMGKGCCKLYRYGSRFEDGLSSDDTKQ